MLVMREIRRKIRMVRNIQQITKAMKLVAAARLKRAQERVVAARPYADKIEEVLQALMAAAPVFPHPLLTKREVKNVGLFIIGSDRGLCGTFNVNIIAKTLEFLRDRGPERTKLIILGRRVYDYFRRQPYEIMANFAFPSAAPRFVEVKGVIEAIRGSYERGAVDEVYLIYTVFVNVLRYVPTAKKLLPIEPPGKKEGEIEFLYEPSVEKILNALLPRYVEMQIYRSILESLTSEHAARTIAMTNATDNAEELLEELTLSLNKARQAMITKEITEISAAAEAMK